MSINIAERQLPKQYENYAIDQDRLRQRFQDKDNEKKKNSVRHFSYDTVEITPDGRSALEQEMVETIRARQGIRVEGRLTSVSSQSVFEEFERAVSAEQRAHTASGNFDRHVDKMVSAYRQMKRAIEEKYANRSQEQSYFITDDKSVQPLTQETELELLDKAYEQHSMAMASFTESLNDLQDFKPQIIYHRSGSHVREQSDYQPQSGSADGAKKKKGEIRDQAYQAFMSAIGKGSFQSGLGSAAFSRSELNRIWDHYA